MESLVAAWDLSPAQNLLSGREENEAYAAADPSNAYVVYFTAGGSVQVDLPPGGYRAHWIDIQTGDWGEKGTIEGGTQSIDASGQGHWVAVIVSDGGV